MSGLYVPYHMHSDLSILDSCTKFQDYIDAAVDEGLKAISISEHGKPLNWVDKWAYCKEKGIKYLHSVEMYLTETLDEKVRDNYHAILIARNQEGVEELNRLIALSSDDEHFYYKNRVDFDTFLKISDNIITTSACLAGPLNKLDEDNPYFSLLAAKFTFYEVQPHKNSEQVSYNKKLLELSQRFNKPLIAATDAHSINEYKAQCRTIFLKAKHIDYDESGFDLTYKTYDQLVDAFKEQDALPKEVYMQAIENTNLLNESCEELYLNTEDIKYPIINGSPERDTEVFEEKTWEMFTKKLESGIVPPEKEQEYANRIQEELNVFKKVGMSGFMLLMSEIIVWCKNNNIAIGTGRGSVAGSLVAYLTEITDVNPMIWGTVFSRFCNENRVEIGDIDIDCIEKQRPQIFKYIIDRFGKRYTARVAAYQTLKSKAVIDEIGRAFRLDWEKDQLDRIIDNRGHEECPWSVKKVDQIKKEFEVDEDGTKRKYPDLFYYYDGLLGTFSSLSIHPAGIVISPIPLTDTYGTYRKDNDNILMLDMNSAHYVNLAKFDFLALKTLELIDTTCKSIGISYPVAHEINWNDKRVFEDMMRSPVGLFQFEGDFAFNSLKKFRPQSVHDVTLVTAAIRPSGASYRDKLFNRQRNKTPSKQIDEMLSESYSFLTFQEQIISFLQDICGLTGSEADTCRRAISKKNLETLESYMPRILSGYCDSSDKPKEVAEAEAKEFLQVIEDASSYGFSKNHGISYSMLTYYCAYYRCYYPGEFITAYLNTAANDDDIRNGAELAKLYGLKVTTPKFGLSRSNYVYNKETGEIARGLESIKFISKKTAETLYELAHNNHYEYFVDLLADVSRTDIDTRQMDILVKLEFFDCFGNQKELNQIIYIFNTLLKSGKARSIKKEKVLDLGLDEIFEKHANGLTKSGAESKSWTNLDVTAIAHDAEEWVKAQHIPDLSLAEKAKLYADVAGYVGFTTGEDKDRSTLYVKEILPLKRKKDGKLFGYSVFYQSIGSGIENRMTVFKGVFDKDPIKEGDVIRCLKHTKDGKYFQLREYRHVG